jgi:hypothetical protein
MDRHGAVCLGKSLLLAFCNLETMEHTALITKTARDLGNVRELEPAEASRLRSMGLKRYGGPPSAVAQADAPHADLPPACTGCSGCAHPKPSGIAPKSELKMARVTNGGLGATLGSVDKQMEDALVREVLRAMAK